MPFDALTNFPNGLITSAVILTEEATIFSENTNLGIGGVSDGITLESNFTFDTNFFGFASALVVKNNITVLPDAESNGGLKSISIEPTFTGFTSNDEFSYRGIFIGVPLFPAGTANAVKYYSGIDIFTHANGHQITSGTVQNHGMIVSNAYSIAGAGGTVLNTALEVIVQGGAGTITSNGSTTEYGIYIRGKAIPEPGVTRWVLYSEIDGPSLFSGPIIQKPAVSTVPANNGEMTVSATSNTSLTVRLKGTDGIVRSTVLTLA